MRLLLDTHAAIWAVYERAKLPGAILDALEAPENVVLVSAVSTWEIAIKQALGKLEVDLDRIVNMSARAGFDELPITVGHTQALRGLDWHHADPFDRLLVAQSVVEGCTVVTRDPIFGAYDVPTTWEK